MSESIFSLKIKKIKNKCEFIVHPYEQCFVKKNYFYFSILFFCIGFDLVFITLYQFYNLSHEFYKLTRVFFLISSINIKLIKD